MNKSGLDKESGIPIILTVYSDLMNLKINYLKMLEDGRYKKLHKSLITAIDEIDDQMLSLQQKGGSNE